MQKLTSEQVRLQEVDKRTGRSPWELWGPYLSERQWGTVREDYSDDGDAWAYTTHDKRHKQLFAVGRMALLAGLTVIRHFVLLQLSGMVKIRC